MSIPPSSGTPNTPPSKNPLESFLSSQHYQSQYKVSPEFRKFWEKLFPNTELTDTEVKQLTDTFTRNVASQMNHVLNHALENMKRLEEERKENSQ